MKIFANKKIWKRLVIILLFITVFSFVTPQSVQASSDATIGGVLMKPICSLLVGFCDGVMNIIHRFVVNQSKTKITIDLTTGILEKLWIAAGIILVGVAVAAAVVATCVTGGVGGFAILTVLSCIKTRNNNSCCDGVSICCCVSIIKLCDSSNRFFRR